MFLGVNQWQKHQFHISLRLSDPSYQVSATKLGGLATMIQPILQSSPPQPHSTTVTTPFLRRHHYDHLLTALSTSTSFVHLKQIHAQVLRSGLDRSNSLLTKLVISTCTLSPSLDYPLSIIDQMYKPELHLCNRFLRELSRSRNPEKTLLVYEKMRREGIVIDRFSFPPLLKATSRVSGLREGRELHGLASKLGFNMDPFIETGLVGMYASCGEIGDARLVFDNMSHRDIVAWNIMIDGCCENGLFDHVLALVDEMKRSKLEPDQRIFSSILSACARAGNLNIGKAIHELIIESNVVIDSHLQSALISMYAACGSFDSALDLFNKLSPKNVVASTIMFSGYSKQGQVEAARTIFNQMREKDLLCWSAMISGYAESDKPQEALKLFDEMQVSGIKPDEVTMLSVISACSRLGTIDQAKRIQHFVEDNGFGRALPVNSALIGMYAKCGSLEKARGVFDAMQRRNVISWSSIINAYAVHGDANNALNLFHQMKSEYIKPNGITFVAVLYACSHAGLVKEGQKIFASMVSDYNISPKLEHYGCMVDLYGRANLIKEALKVIEIMPLAPNVVIWGALMAACRVQNEIELGEFAAKRILELDSNHDGAHVFLSNIYAKESRWENVRDTRNLMQHKGISKERGWSRIAMKCEVHEFLTADKNHRQVTEIYAKLEKVVGMLKLVGYVPNTSCVLVDLDEEEKKEVILWHSEKLALCYGLINDEDRSSCIHIIKNLRICEDCHTFMKLASKIYEREIIVRDRTRFHHFKDGVCSCKDYW